MISGSIFNALKGISDEFEVTRILGALGTVVYTIIAPVFVAIGVIDNVTLTEFSLTYPAGLTACLAATAGAVAWKDKGVATSKVIQQTGAVPTPATTGPQVPTRDLPPEGSGSG